MSEAIPWKLLQAQYFSDSTYEDEIAKLVHSPEDVCCSNYTSINCSVIGIVCTGVCLIDQTTFLSVLEVYHETFVKCYNATVIRRRCSAHGG